MSIRIVTDSACDLSQATVDSNGISVVAPLATAVQELMEAGAP